MGPKIMGLCLAVITIVSCQKYREYDPFEVIENDYTGGFSISLTAGDVDGTYDGMSDSGRYVFIWNNPSKGVVFNVDHSLVIDGNMQVIMRDARGREVLNENFGTGSTKALSKDGKKGKWKVEITLSDFEGEGSFDLNPVN